MKISLILSILILFFTGCKDDIAGVDDVIIPSVNVSYNQYIQPVFNLHCTGCHNENTKEGDLSLTTWSNTTADPNIVFPGEPDVSRLVWTIEAKSGVSPMPPVGAPYKPLNANQVAGVRTWIKEGAKNN